MKGDNQINAVDQATRVVEINPRLQIVRFFRQIIGVVAVPSVIFSYHRIAHRRTFAFRQRWRNDSMWLMC